MGACEVNNDKPAKAFSALSAGSFNVNFVTGDFDQPHLLSESVPSSHISVSEKSAAVMSLKLYLFTKVYDTLLSIVNVLDVYPLASAVTTYVPASVALILPPLASATGLSALPSFGVNT